MLNMHAKGLVNMEVTGTSVFQVVHCTVVVVMLLVVILVVVEDGGLKRVDDDEKPRPAGRQVNECRS